MRVICGIGDAPDSAHVVEHAEALSRRLGADLVVVNVAEAPRPSSEGPPLPFDPATYRSGALEAGESLLREHAGPALAAGARGRVELGDPATRLADVAIAEGASLVVVGWRHRRFGLRSRRLRNLLRRCQCPVVVVGPGAR